MFANAEAAGGTELAVEGTVDPDSGLEITPSMISAMEMPSRMASMSSIVSLPKRRSRMQAIR